MDHGLNYVPLLLVLLLAFAVPLLLSRLRVFPVVVGEILAGVIIGRSGLGLVEANPTLDIFSNIGLSFLMFLAGMEIDFSRLFPGKNGNGSNKNLAGLALQAYLLTFLLALGSGFLLNRLGLPGDPWLLAFILSATSLGVLLPIMKERKLAATEAGVLIFLTAVLADFATVLLLTVYLLTRNNGLSLQVFSFGLLFVAFALVYLVGGKIIHQPAVRRLIEELSHATVQIKVRGAIAILMAFVALAGALGVELILGAFLAGMVISLIKTPQDADLVHKLEAFGFGFFIPVFFIQVGAELDLRSLFESPESLLLLAVLLGLSLLVKGLPTLLFRRVLSWRETLAGAALLNTHLSLEIAVAVIGRQLGLLSPAASVAAVLFATITVLTMPLAFNALMPASRKMEPAWMAVFGAEDLGMQVGRILRQHGEAVVLLDVDPFLVEKARQAGFDAIEADSIVDCLQMVSQRRLQALLVLTADDTRNLLVSKAAVEAGLGHVIALVNNAAQLSKFRSLGVQTYAPALFRPALLAQMALSPDIFTLLTAADDQNAVREIHFNNPLHAGNRLQSLTLPDNLLVLAVNRQGELIVPHGRTRLEMGDRLTVLGSAEALEQAAQRLENGTV